MGKARNKVTKTFSELAAGRVLILKSVYLNRLLLLIVVSANL